MVTVVKDNSQNQFLVAIDTWQQLIISLSNNRFLQVKKISNSFKMFDVIPKSFRLNAAKVNVYFCSK